MYGGREQSGVHKLQHAPPKDGHCAIGRTRCIGGIGHGILASLVQPNVEYSLGVVNSHGQQCGPK